MATSLRLVVRIEGHAVGGTEQGNVVPQWHPVIEKIIDMPAGTTVGQIDSLAAPSGSAAAAVATVDLRGSLSSPVTQLGTQSFTDLVLMWIENQATTTGKTLDVGAGSNPVTSWVKASGDAVKLYPGGFFLYYAGAVDDCGTTAATGDIISLDPGANTVAYQTLFAGRSV